MHCSKNQGKNKDNKIMKYLIKKIIPDPSKYKEKAIFYIYTDIKWLSEHYRLTGDQSKKCTGYENLHAKNSIVLADRRTDGQPYISIIE